MRVLSYAVRGKTEVGIVRGDRVSKFPAASLYSILREGRLNELKTFVGSEADSVGLDEIEFLPVIPTPGKIIAVGINYDSHRKETGRDKSLYPMIFARFADAQTGHLQPMIKPSISDKFDYEGELAVIIGTEGRNITPESALSHVAGYSIYNDGSVRDWQRHTSQYTPGKNFPATGPFGPWMVTTDEIPDPQKLTLETRLNGKTMQKSGTDMMIFSVAELISYVSTFSVVYPGDVIITGTPGGVGARFDPPVFMKDGDTIEVEISGIGILRNRIISETAYNKS